MIFFLFYLFTAIVFRYSFQILLYKCKNNAQRSIYCFVFIILVGITFAFKMLQVVLILILSRNNFACPRKLFEVFLFIAFSLSFEEPIAAIYGLSLSQFFHSTQSNEKYLWSCWSKDKWWTIEYIYDSNIVILNSLIVWLFWVFSSTYSWFVFFSISFFLLLEATLHFTSISYYCEVVQRYWKFLILFYFIY